MDTRIQPQAKAVLQAKKLAWMCSLAILAQYLTPWSCSLPPSLEEFQSLMLRWQEPTLSTRIGPQNGFFVYFLHIRPKSDHCLACHCTFELFSIFWSFNHATCTCIIRHLLGQKLFHLRSWFSFRNFDPKYWVHIISTLSFMSNTTFTLTLF